ncbi:disease resistance-like protein DSC2 [Rhodamnia argentea]|uniref:Disease resistance-like protein DSC2 n=1 Tax=Rhodamnia argentea TaxID=178133 RepID=A0ABM3GXY9_9MYRT|nr:disease resistance-like protein DSC2 [Rhodamnia argentea]
MEDLSKLKELSSLKIESSAISEIEALGCLENLKELELRGLGQVKILPDLSNANKLRRLALEKCGNLVEIQGELPQYLEKLKITFCKSLRKLPDLSSLMRLRDVVIPENLVEIQAELPQQLYELEIDSCESLQELPDL